MANKEVTLAAACMVAEHDKAKNLKKYVKFIEEAAAKGADFLAFSEVSLQGYFWASRDDPVQMEEQRKYYEREAEPIPGPASSLIEKQCKEHNMYIQYGFAEKSSEGIHNSAVLIGPEGIVGVHRKTFAEAVVKEGNCFEVYNIKLGKFGMVICADLSYAPECVRMMVANGAEVVVDSTAWGIPLSPLLPDGKSLPGYISKMNVSRVQTPSKLFDPDWMMTEYREYQYDTLSRGSAMINQVWLVRSDTVGPSMRMHALGQKGGENGHSIIVTPIGKIIAEVGYKEGIAMATVDIKGGIRAANKQFGRKSFEYWYPEAHAPLFDKNGIHP